MLQSALSIYQIKTDILEQLQPTHIITDGNSYFNRPGPRLADSLEILAEIIHPEIFQYGYQGRGWEKF